MSFAAYLLLTTKFGKKKLVTSTLMKFEDISVIEEVYGRWDIIIRVEADSSASFEEFVQNKIRTIEDIEKAETLVIANINSDDEDEESG